MNRPETATLLQTIVALYPSSRLRADELTVNLWHEMLNDLPGEVVSAAVKRMCAVLKFPPSVADVREAVAKAVQEAQGVPSAGEAWARVQRAASWYGFYRPDEARHELGEDIWRAVQQVGGWREICAGDSPAGVISAQFERRYTAMIDQQRDLVQIPESVREDMARLVCPLVDKLRLDAGGGEAD